MAMSSHMAPGATRHRGVVSAAPSTENRFPPQHAVSRPWPWPKLVSPRAMAPTDPGRVVPRRVPAAGSHKYPRDLALMPPGEAAACPAGRWAGLSAWAPTGYQCGQRCRLSVRARAGFSAHTQLFSEPR